MSNSNFKIGDRVILTDKYKHHACGSDTGTIVSFQDPVGYNAVKFDGCKQDVHKMKCNGFNQQMEILELLVEEPKTEEYIRAVDAMKKWLGDDDE